MNPPQRLLTRDFLILNLIVFLAYSNIAVFFQFNQYLAGLSLTSDQAGILISLFALMALILRPLISPVFNAVNARGYMVLGLVGVMLSLCLYYPADSFWPLALVRLAHGGFHTVLATAALARMVACIPPSQSSRAFGLFTVVTLLPYAVMPAAIDALMDQLGGFRQILLAMSLLMLPALALLPAVGPLDMAKQEARLTWADIKANLSNPGVMLMLLVSLLVFTAFTPVFYYLHSFGQKIGISNPGVFFTLSTCAEISVRLFSGSLLDRLPKLPMLGGSLAVLACGYLLLPYTNGLVMFLALGLTFGLAWGAALPLLNAIIFDLSPVRFKALNANLGMETFQGGFFFGPLLGGWVLDHGGYVSLYFACSSAVVLGIALLPVIGLISRAQK